MTEQNSIDGLSSEQALELQMKFGRNELTAEKKGSIFGHVFKALSEPMFILLLVAAII